MRDESAVVVQIEQNMFSPTVYEVDRGPREIGREFVCVRVRGEPRAEQFGFCYQAAAQKFIERSRD
jgi:hypothetical protein